MQSVHLSWDLIINILKSSDFLNKILYISPYYSKETHTTVNVYAVYYEESQL